MEADLIIVTLILAGVVILFVTGWIRFEIVPLLIPAALVISGLVSAEQVFAGFASTAVITVASLFVITTGLVRSGVVNRAADSLHRLAGRSRRRLLLAGTLLPGAVAGFIIVTATVLFFIPTIMRMALQGRIPRSQLLLPLVASCLLGANLTLIGASHNLVVNSLAENSLGYGFSFFEFMPLGLILLVTAVLYSLLFSHRLLPSAEPSPKSAAGTGENLVDIYGLAELLWELWVPEQSPAAGKTIRELGLGEHFGLCVIAVVRAGEQLPPDFNTLILKTNDILLLLGSEERARELAAGEDLFLAGHPRKQNRFSISTAELIEVVVPPRSPVIGQTLTGLHLREETGLSGIALWRAGAPLLDDVGSTPLVEGDGLLLFGDHKKTRGFKPGRRFRWLHQPRREEAPPELRRFGPLAVLILLAVILTAALGLLPLAVAAVTGAAAMVLCGILQPRELYSSVEWQVIVLIGCLYPLGTALYNSGASTQLAAALLRWGGYNPLAVLAIIAALSILLTQPLHNVAAAVIMTPVALNAALGLGVNPKTFLMAVIIGSSAAFMLPAGHPVSLLVRSPGGYETRDYFRFGLGLALLVLLIIVIFVPLVWPLGG